ncbi:MAG: hypothetical protein M3011_00580 [Actinomycetota bacterium]|nr:hypothetical protein [Actinomycetota bacterium]
MPDTPDLKSVEEGGSITGQKILKLAKDDDVKVDDGILSPYRDEVLDS